MSVDPTRLRSKASIKDLNDRNSKQEEFDLQERKLTALQNQIETLKEDRIGEQRLNAQLEYGISNLAERLGLEKVPDESMGEKLKKCNAKIKQLQKEKDSNKGKSSLSQHAASSSHSVMSS